MTDYCLFTVEHGDARRIYIRGIADITEPIDDYDKIIEFYEGNELKNELPSNPYNKGEKDYELFEELLKLIRTQFEEFGDELVFASEEEEYKKYVTYDWNLTTKKVTI